MVLKSVACPACGGREFTLEEVVEDDELTGIDLRCARLRLLHLRGGRPLRVERRRAE